jgi:hypothetical protein
MPVLPAIVLLATRAWFAGQAAGPSTFDVTHLLVHAVERSFCGAHDVLVIVSGARGVGP